MTENLALRTAHHDRRDELLELQRRWEEDIRTLTPAMGEPDRYSFERAMLSDLISNVQRRIDDLTDEIGDERGHDYKAPFGGAGSV